MSELLLVVFAVLLIVVSALCSGLNVALMSLDITNLQRQAKLGNGDAKIALAIRRRTHLSLASILLTNVAVISATSLVLSSFLNGFVAGIISTLLIVVFGEILPQAFAVKHALRAIALFAPFLKLIIYLSYPISKPLQVLLDKLVGRDEGRLHTRHELGLIIADHIGDESELDDDEVEIAQNALQLSEKRVKEIMTPIKRVFYLRQTDKIDGPMIDKLKEQNWSRIPIMSDQLDDCVGFIHLKDLVDIDFDERAYSLKELKIHKAKTVGSMTALDTLFRKFITAKSHLIAVEKNQKIIGIVTIEDLIEEIIGKEIHDESDAEQDRNAFSVV